MMKTILSTILLLALPAAPAQALVFFDQFDYEPQMSLVQGYDDNINSDSRDAISDFFTNVELGLDMKSEQRTHEIVFSGRVTEQVFASESDFNNLRQDYSVLFRQELSRYDRISVTDSYTRAEDTDVFQDLFGRINDRYVYDLNRFAVDYSRDFTRQLSFAFNYQNEYYNPDRADLSESTLNAGSVQADYYYSSATIASFVYKAARRAFDPGESAMSHSVLAGIRHYLTSQLYIEGQGGVDFIENFNGDRLTEPRYSVSLVNDIDENTRLGITFTKDFTTNNYTADVFNTWRVSVNLARQLLERMTVYGSGFFGKGEYDSLKIKDDLLGLSLGLRYQVSRDITANFGYTYTETDSDIDTRDYQRNRVYLGMDIRF